MCHVVLVKRGQQKKKKVLSSRNCKWGEMKGQTETQNERRTSLSKLQLTQATQIGLLHDWNLASLGI